VAGVTGRKYDRSKTADPTRPCFSLEGILQITEAFDVPRIIDGMQTASKHQGLGTPLRTERSMGRRFAQIAFTPQVKRNQEIHGSRRQYQRVEDFAEDGNVLSRYEQEFISERDGFYIASVSESGWPYIQYRGGPRGFLRILNDRTIGFVDLRGNKQYISVGNLQNDSRVALFLMDYVRQQRLKILGRVRIVENTSEADELIRSLKTDERSAVPERVMLIQIEAFDWNCPQHIAQRFTIDEILEFISLDDLAKMKAAEKSQKSKREPEQQTIAKGK
jgi:predicted pyridoxine 5'-phosphate oxidase superfamily flavin-nucleotide-binding protein